MFGKICNHYSRAGIVLALFLQQVWCAPFPPHPDEYFKVLGIEDWHPYPTIGPEARTDEMPSYTFDSDDVGGYTWHFYNVGLWASESTASDSFPNFILGADTDAMAWVLMTTYDFGAFRLPKDYATDFYNCSANVFGSSDFYGKFDSTDVICNPDECCTSTVRGAPKLNGNDPNSVHQNWNGILSSGMCDAISEVSYCIIVVHANDHCIQMRYDYMIKERAYLFPCSDAVILALFSCKLYASQGIAELLSYLDTPIFVNKLTVLNQLVMYGPTHSYDPVCIPYLYYYPDFDTASSTSDSGEVDNGSSEGNVDSHTFTYSIIVTLAMMLLFVDAY